MQRIPIFIRTAKQYNAVWRSGELIAVKNIKPGDAVTIPTARGILFSDYIFKTTTKFPLPRTNTFFPQSPGPTTFDIRWQAARGRQDPERL
tara:strand:- start:53 stop:325 length:273 start_codon:yes stop_codon:yes gene_type:complete